MNDLVKADTQQQDPATIQLLTIKPENYVAEVFKPFKTELRAAIRAASKTPDYDITTTAGLTVAKQLRATFKAIRTSAENTRKERKAPILEIGKLLDTRYKELEAEIKPHEDKYDAEVKAEEERKQRIKDEEIARERARIEAIENRLANIRNIPSRHLQSSSDAIRKEIDEQSTLVLDPNDYDEFHEDAIAAVNAVLVELERMRKIAAEREAEQARIEAERKELARLKAENDAREKREREEREAREREEAQRKAEQEAAAAAQARRIAELEAQLAAANKAKEPEQKEVPAEAAQPLQLSDIAREIMPAGVREAFTGEVSMTTETPPCQDIAPWPSGEQIVTALMSAFDMQREDVIAMLHTTVFPAQ